MTRQIPTLDDLAGALLVHRFDDAFNPPGLTNFLGAAQVDLDVAAVRSVNFPPVAGGDTISGTLFLDGRLLRSLTSEVTVRWRPDRVVRTARVGEIELETVTSCPPGETAVVVEIGVRNLGSSSRGVRIGLAFAARVTASAGPWRWSSADHPENTLSQLERALLGVCNETGAACVQGVDHDCVWLAENTLEVSLNVPARGGARLGLVHALGENTTKARAAYERIVGDVPGAIAASERQWSREIAGVFEHDAPGFSGSLPVLETESDALRRLYWTGILGVLYVRRDSPHSVLGRAYDTLMPRYWQTTTFIWDYSLSSIVHALLDPEPMRRQLEHWIGTDVHAHYGTEWLSGSPVGVWYSVNDYAMTRLVRDYVRFSGNTSWLAHALKTPSGRTQSVGEHVRGWARHWQTLRGTGALADYGGVDNLLECVSTYTNEVASLNAANVWCMRVAAELAENAGEHADARLLRDEADELVRAVMELYIPGEGCWNTRRPDGRLVPVRHCYDFQTTGSMLAGDIDAEQRREMVDFFVRELQTETWMRALSPRDPDAATSVRPDHQWNGAYTAWPAEAAQALFRLGADEVALSWLSGLARSTREGPFAQGHFVGGHGTGAAKAPPQPPYLIDWACSSSGAFVALVIEGVFGVDVTLAGEVTATPRVERLDRNARLRGLRIGGRSYDVTAAGLENA